MCINIDLFLAAFFLFGTALANAGQINQTKHGRVSGKPFVNIQNQIDDHEIRISDIEEQPVATAILVYADNGDELGVLLSALNVGGWYEIYMPSIKKFCYFIGIMEKFLNI